MRSISTEAATSRYGGKDIFLFLIIIIWTLSAFPACQSKSGSREANPSKKTGRTTSLGSIDSYRAPLPKDLPQPKAAEEGYFARLTFESGYQNVQSFRIAPNVAGAWLSLPLDESRKSRFLHLVNKRATDSFGSTLLDREFDVREFPIVEFDYRSASGVRIALLFYSGKCWYELPFKRIRDDYPSARLRPLGLARSFIDDGDWHHISIDLGKRMRLHPHRLISKIVLAHVSSNADGAAKSFTNTEGAWFDIDNIVVRVPDIKAIVPTASLHQNQLSLRPTLGTEPGEDAIYEWGLPYRDLRSGLEVSREKLARIVLTDAPPDSRYSWTLALTGDGDQSEEIEVTAGGKTVHRLRAAPELRVYSFDTKTSPHQETEIICRTRSERKSAINSVHVERWKPELWTIGLVDNSNGEFADEMDVPDDYTVGTDTFFLERAVSRVDPQVRLHFSLTPKQAGTLHLFQLTALAWDGMYKKSGGPGIRLEATLNDRSIKDITVGSGPQTHFSIPLKDHLIPGHNVIALKHAGGADWLTWDWMAIRSADESANDLCLWDLVESETHPFALESQAPEEFIIGSGPRHFRRAVTRDNKQTHILFNYKAKNEDMAYQLIAEPKAWDLSDSGVVKFSVAVNYKTVGTPLVKKGNQNFYTFALGNLLKPGENRITLRWLGGSSWLAWKRVALCRASEHVTNGFVPNKEAK